MRPSNGASLVLGVVGTLPEAQWFRTGTLPLELHPTEIAASIWGRLFLWLGSIAGSLLIIVIVAMVLHFGDRTAQSGTAQSRRDVDTVTSGSIAAPATGQELSTYHPTEVTVGRIRMEQKYQRVSQFSGRLVPKHESRLGFELGGQLEMPLVEVGQAVVKGQALAQLNTELLAVQLQQVSSQKERAEAQLSELQAGHRQTTIQAAQADVDALETEVQHATRLRERQEELVEQGGVSQHEFEAAVTSEQGLLKRRLAAQQRLDELNEGTRPEQIVAQLAFIRSLLSEEEGIQLQINKATLQAPYSGFITKQSADAGEILSPGQPLFEIVQNDPLEAYVGVSAEVAACLIPGNDYTLSTGPSRTTARLLRTIPVIDPATQTITAIFELEAVPHVGVWVPGRLVQWHWQTEVPATGFWVPNDALVRARRGLWSLYQLSDENSHSAPADWEPDEAITGRVRQHLVEILHSDQQWSYVRGTLENESWIVVQGAHRLLDGQRVLASSRTFLNTPAADLSGFTPLRAAIWPAADLTPVLDEDQLPTLSTEDR